MRAPVHRISNVEDSMSGHVYVIPGGKSMQTMRMRPRPAGSRMLLPAVLLIVLGCLAGITAYTMSTYVGAGDRRLLSVGLMEGRRDFLMLAELMTVVGVVLFAMGKANSQRAWQDPLPFEQDPTPRQFPADRTMASDQYRLYLAKTWQIERNDVLEKFVVNGELFSSCADALACAHALDVAAEAQDEARRHEDEKLADARRKAAEQARPAKAAVATSVGEYSAIVADWMARPKSGTPHSVVLQDLQESLDRQDVTPEQFFAIRRQLLF